jgi:hypothetical protein
MKSNELRIGNYYYDLDKEITQIEMLSPFLNDFKNRWEWLKYIEPIPLTEEWLFKLGFYKEEKKASKNHGFYFSKCIEDYKYSFAFADFRNDWGFYHSYTDAPNEEDNNKFDCITVGIKHVHQLQNLYFALTNNELEIL